MTQKCLIIILEKARNSAPGLLALLNYISITKYTKTFEAILVSDPNKAYEIVLEALHEEIWADLFLKTILDEVINKNNVTVEKFLSSIKQGKKLNLKDYSSIC